MSVPWDQTQEFLRTSDWTTRPGGPRQYHPPREIGKDDYTDVTSFHPGQANWGPENIPDILYVYKPPQEWQDFKRRPERNGRRPARLPPAKRNPDGTVVLEQWPLDPQRPQELLDFKHLPDQVGTREYWWVFEAWRRLDPRIRWKDIWMRQKAGNRSKSETGNGIEMLVSRSRCHLNIIAWEPQKPHLNRHRRQSEHQAKIEEKMTQVQIDNNTTRGLTPGLVDPAQGENSRRIQWPKLAKGTGQHKGPRKPRQHKQARADRSSESDATEDEDTSYDDAESQAHGSQITSRQMETQRYAAAALPIRDDQLSRRSPPGSMRRMPENSYAQDLQPGLTGRRTNHPLRRTLDKNFRSPHGSHGNVQRRTSGRDVRGTDRGASQWNLDPSNSQMGNTQIQPSPPLAYLQPPAVGTSRSAAPNPLFGPPVTYTRWRPIAPSSLFGPPIHYIIRRPAASSGATVDNGSGLREPHPSHNEASRPIPQSYHEGYASFTEWLGSPDLSLMLPAMRDNLGTGELLGLSSGQTPETLPGIHQDPPYSGPDASQPSFNQGDQLTGAARHDIDDGEGNP
ncbi:MAG: hypothetical protein Q9220_002268 [cf. Caloplaca sp. 1 TL-2023]